MRQIRNALILLFLFSLAVPGHSQQASQREWTIFQKGVREYRQGQYEQAERNFSLVISKLPNSNLITANYLMLAKSQYKNENYSNSLRTCQNFLSDFPKSKYTDDIIYLMGNNYYRLDRLQTAASTWLELTRSGQSQELVNKAVLLAENLIRYRLDGQAINHLKSEFKDPLRKQILLFNLAEREYEQNKSSEALAFLDEFDQIKGGSTDYKRRADDLRDIIKNKKSNGIRIAALLPLSGTNADLGKAFLNGAKMAVSDYNSLHQSNIELVALDYETRLTTAVEKMKEIVADPSILAVFGPLENDITAACAIISDYEDIALITPTATGNNLTKLSDHLVQLSTPVDQAGRILAEFAYDSLQLNRMVTLAPIEDHFLTLTESFVNTYQDYRNDVISQQWYYPGDQDIARQFKTLKRIGLKLEFQDSLLLVDSTMALTSIDSLYKIYLSEEQEKLKETRTTLDSADIPVTTFDGIFMPIYQDDINFIAPQFAYFNIQAQLLGNADWYEPKALKKNKNYINGMILISDGYLDENNWDYKQFRNSFRTMFETTPEKYEICGYDGFRFVLNALPDRAGSVTRSRFIDYIKSEGSYSGIYKNIHVGAKRYNDAARILKYLYGQIVPLR